MQTSSESMTAYLIRSGDDLALLTLLYFNLNRRTLSFSARAAAAAANSIIALIALMIERRLFVVSLASASRLWFSEIID